MKSEKNFQNGSESAAFDKEDSSKKIELGADSENKEIEKKIVQDLKEKDQQKAAEETEIARKSIFGRIGDMFKGKEKSDEEKYEDDMKSLEKTIHSLTHISVVDIDLGASFRGGVDNSVIKSEALKNKLNEILEINKKLQKTDRGQEKVDLMYKKRNLIGELSKIGREEIKNKYNMSA